MCFSFLMISSFLVAKSNTVLNELQFYNSYLLLNMFQKLDYFWNFHKGCRISQSLHFNMESICDGAFHTGNGIIMSNLLLQVNSLIVKKYQKHQTWIVLILFFFLFPFYSISSLISFMWYGFLLHNFIHFS